MHKVSISIYHNFGRNNKYYVVVLFSAVETVEVAYQTSTNIKFR